jgi:hypothetical protein
MKKVLVAALSLAAISSANAGDMWVEINGLSRHIGGDTYTWQGETKKYNEVNPGLGLGIPLHKNIEAKVGFYENSYDITSAYAGGFFHLNMNLGELKVEPGVTLGVVTGYSETVEQAMRVQPIGYLNVQVGYRGVRLGVGYLPSRLAGGDVDVVTLNLGLRL